MTEFELKLEIPPDRLQAVEAAVRRAQTVRQRLQARYFDTHDHALARHGIVVRLRQEGRQWVQTAKASNGDAIERLEHNVPLDSRSTPTPDLARHRGTPLGRRISKALNLKKSAEAVPALELVYRTDVIRLARIVRSGPVAIELALDVGRVSAGRRSTPVHELELELKQGNPAHAVELARSWCLAHGLWLSAVSKSMRGLRLRQGQQFGAAVHGQTPRIARRDSARAVAAAVVSSCLDQILANASDIAAGCCGTEHIHQLRIGLRRLRTAVRELGDWMPGLDPAWEPPSVALFRMLGRHRDRSYLVDNLQREIEAGGGPPLDWSRTWTDLPDVGESVRSPRFQEALLGLVAFVHAAPTGADSDSSAARIAPEKILGRRLRKLHRRVIANGRKFLALDEPAQHGLRKQAKRLRYLAEFARPLFAADRVDPYLSALEPIQDALGLYHDELTALAAWQHLAASEPRAWFGAGWLAARRPANARACLKACTDFAGKAKPFWD